MRILVVDDNPENIILVSDILAIEHYVILTAYDGEQAVEMARTQHPDLILMDINMPNMSGLEACDILKASHETRHIPIIMLTAQIDVDSRVDGIKRGADDYLTKPFSPRELLARVERSLRSKRANDNMRATQQALVKQQEHITQTFARYVAAPIVDQLLQNPTQIKLGGQLQPITVLFADLQGFTSLSENIAPKKLLHILNNYHTFMVNIVLKYGGTIDKFLGDGLMALYNTPIEQPDHIARAVKTALHIQDEIHWFTAELPPEQRMKINFGIHSGKAIVGNVGSENLMDFTAVGDTVNVAARLQGVADNGEILVTSTVYDATKNFVFGRSRGALQVKGRNSTITAYQISNTFFEADSAQETSPST